MLGEEDNTQVGPGRFQGGSRTGALVGERGRKPDVEDDDIWRVLPDRILEVVAITQRGDDVVSCIAEQPGKALAQQCLVLDEYHPHGNSAARLSARAARPLPPPESRRPPATLTTFRRRCPGTR